LAFLFPILDIFFKMNKEMLYFFYLFRSCDLLSIIFVYQYLNEATYYYVKFTVRLISLWYNRLNFENLINLLFEEGVFFFMLIYDLKIKNISITFFFSPAPSFTPKLRDNYLDNLLLKKNLNYLSFFKIFVRHRFTKL